MNKTLLWRAAFIIVVLGLIGIAVGRSMHLNKLSDQLLSGTDDQQTNAATELMQRDKLFEKMQVMSSTDRIKIMDVIAKIPGELTIKQTLPLFKDTEAKLRVISQLAETENRIRSLQFYQDEKTKARNAPLLKEETDQRADLIKLRDAETTLHTKIVNVLKVLAKDNLEILVPAMKDPDVFVGIGVKDTLVAIGAKVIPDMKRSAIEEDLRPHAFEVLQRIGEPSVPTLIELLHNKDQNIRMAAAAALGVVAKPSATLALMEATNDVEAVRRLAVSSLCAICDPRSTDVLVYVLSHTTDDGEVRARSARALSIIGGTKAVNTLVGALADLDLKVQSSVITGLQHIGGPAVNPISAAIASGNLETRRSGAAALEHIDSPEAANVLLTLSHNSDTAIRASAARGLGSQTVSPKTDALVAMLADPDGLVGDAASGSLQNMGGRIVPSLMSLIGSGAGDVAKYRAASILGKIGPPAVPALINSIGTSGANTKWVAYALGHTGDSRAKPVLKKYASASDPNLEAVVQAALHRP